MVEAIRDDTAITEAQKELLQVASLPLYKILTVQAAYGRGMPTDDRETLAEIASVDLLFAVLDRIVSEAGRSMSSFIGADEAKIAMWQGQVNAVRQAARGPAGQHAAAGHRDHADHREDRLHRERARRLDVARHGGRARLVARGPEPRARQLSKS